MEEVAERTRELIERGRTEDALRESESRWRGLFERMVEGFFVGEGVRDATGQIADFRFVQLNPAFEHLTGIAPAAAMGRRVTEVIPGFQREIIDAYARVIETGEPAEFEVQVPALNDRWYEARARKVSQYQFRAPSEWFAEAYAAYYQPKSDGTCDHSTLGTIDPDTKDWFDANVDSRARHA